MAIFTDVVLEKLIQHLELEKPISHLVCRQVLSSNNSVEWERVS